jgi:hypothetical protein
MVCAKLGFHGKKATERFGAVEKLEGRACGGSEQTHGGEAGSRVGHSAEQSHARVKPQERSFYVPNLFSF